MFRFKPLHFCIVFLSTIIFLTPWVSASAKEVIDLKGNKVNVPTHPKRVLLGEGRFTYALEALGGGDLFDRIVGWRGEFKTKDTQDYKQLSATYPQISRIPILGSGGADTINPESVLSLHPDLVILSANADAGGSMHGLLSRLADAQIPVILIDFRHDPVSHTVASMRILGEALDRQKEATEFNKFYIQKLKHIQKLVATIPMNKRPTVFLDRRAISQGRCCHTVGHGDLGRLVETVGGSNIAASLLPGVFGEISTEQLISANPDFIIMDGSRAPDAVGNGIQMGALVSSKQARASLQKAVSEAPELNTLKALKAGHIYGLWHGFHDNPANIVAIEAFAKWMYPSLFAELDPDADFKEIHERFTHLPVTGTYWTSLEPPVFVPAT